MDRPLRDEARRLLRSARVLLEEFAEEGVEVSDRRRATDRGLGSLAQPPPVSASSGASISEPWPSPANPSAPDAGTDPGHARPETPSSLDEVRASIGDCTRCRLHQGRTHLVFGGGNPRASLMFIGEAPGEQEDLQGLPFIGRAGELLTNMIEKGLGISRSDVYVCNIVKCRPPGNRTPLPDEIAACRPFLDAQIDAVSPRVIVALGKPATSLLLGRDVAITKLRGTWQTYRGIPVMPTFHPAFLLRQYTTENRRLVWEDLKAALQRASDRT